MVSNDDVPYVRTLSDIQREIIHPVIANTGGVLAIIVPTGERWTVKAISTMGDALRVMKIYLESPTVGDFYNLSETENTEKYNKNPVLPTPIVLSAGWSILGYFDTAATGSYFLKVLYEKEIFI